MHEALPLVLSGALGGRVSRLLAGPSLLEGLEAGHEVGSHALYVEAPLVAGGAQTPSEAGAYMWTSYLRAEGCYMFNVVGGIYCVVYCRIRTADAVLHAVLLEQFAR